MQGPIVDLAPSGSHLCGFRQPVPSQSLLKTFIGNGEGDCSGQKSTEKSMSHVEGYHCGFKRGGLIEDAELSSPKKRKLSVSDTGGNSSCSADLCSESNGCLVYVYRATDGKDSSDRESIYSVQSKVTEIVKDSSDDLWFLEEDANSDQFSVDVYADEFDVMSERYSETDSDMDNLTSQEDVIVICEESDLEFFADCEWSNIDDDSSDDDLLQGDKWFCLTCQHMNGPLHRFCESCWTLRPNWLPKSSPKTPVEHSESLENKDSVALHVAERDECLNAHAECNKLEVLSSLNASDSQFKEHADAELNRGEVSVEGCSVALESTGDNGIVCQEMQSSQDSGFGSIPLNVLSLSQIQSVTPSSSDVSLASLDKSPRDCFSVSNSTPGGEMLNLPVPPSMTASCHAPSGSCIICLSQPKEATIVHGTTGHQSCCYRCACRLKRCRKPCPVCRRDIQKVVRNYFV